MQLDHDAHARYLEQYWRDREWRFGRWAFRPETGAVLIDGQLMVPLTETESETLIVLLRAYPLPRKRIIVEMRRVGAYWHIDTAKVVVARIRAKIGAEGILTDTRGYRFNAEYFCG